MKWEILTDLKGNRYALVDTPQAKQTRGYFIYYVVNNKHEWTREATSEFASYFWEVDTLKAELPAQGTTFLDWFKKSVAGGQLCMCPLEEVDEEENEFGIISP